MMTVSDLVFSLFISYHPLDFKVLGSSMAPGDWLAREQVQTLRIKQNDQEFCVLMKTSKTLDQTCLQKSRLGNIKKILNGAYMQEAPSKDGFTKVTFLEDTNNQEMQTIVIEKNLGPKESLYKRTFKVELLQK